LTARAGVLGFPAGHSRSPAMMNAAFAELGLDWRYQALPVSPERFEETVRALPGSGYRAANVTIPHKLAAHGLADELSEPARAIGAVNTLSFEDGRIVGHNTDAGGLLDALGEPVPATALVLGAGGAARAAAWALREAGAEVRIWNRTAARATALARELGVASGKGGAELLVNATSIGLHPDDPLTGLPLVEARVVVDLVYGDAPTPIARWAEERGARLVDGLEVLVRQGALSLAFWTGREPPLEVMRRAVVQAASSTSAQV
jgi:shikimate dehydrogenase